MCKIGRGIHKRKDGRYEARICIGRNPDGSYNYLYGVDFNLAVAKDKLQVRLVQHEREQNAEMRHNALFSTVTEKWLDVYGKVRKTSTVAKYTDYCNCYILPMLGNKNISDITSMDITALYCKLTNDADFTNALTGAGGHTVTYTSSNTSAATVNESTGQTYEGSVTLTGKRRYAFAKPVFRTEKISVGFRLSAISDDRPVIT